MIVIQNDGKITTIDANENGVFIQTKNDVNNSNSDISIHADGTIKMNANSALGSSTIEMNVERGIISISGPDIRMADIGPIDNAPLDCLGYDSEGFVKINKGS